MILDQKTFEICLQKYKKQISDTWEELALKFGFPSGENLRVTFKRERQKRGIQSINIKQQVSANGETVLEYGESTEIHGDGSITSDKLISIVEADSKTPDSVMLAHGFDPDLWNLERCRNNLWHGQVKGGDRKILYQSRITVKPKAAGEWSTDFIDRIFDKLSLKAPALSGSIKVKNIIKNGKILVVGISDLHLGLLSTDHTTGNEYNAEIAERLYLETIAQIKQEVEHKPLERIVFLVGNDFLNFDNVNNSTQRGTLMDNDTLWFDLVDKAVELVIKGINEFLPLAPVDTVYVPSNHDLESFYGVMRVVEMYYRNNPNVKVDYSPLPRKYYQYGKNLFGFSHDISVKKSLDIITVEAKDQWSSSEHMYWMLAHLHTGMIYEKRGHLEIYRLPTLSGWSKWSNNKGYMQTERKTQSFIVDEEKGITNVINTIV